MPAKIRTVFIKILQAPIYAYRFVLSPWIGHSCRFHPTCSIYALEALDKHGPLKGVKLTLFRLLKCHPFYKTNFHDPVP